MYIIAFIDRSNVAFVKGRLEHDIGIGDGAFAFGAGLFFLGYCLCEVPSNLLLCRYGARRWLARIMLSWGLVSAATAFVTGAHSFFLMRLLLGACEAGFFPGVVFLLANWFPEDVRGRILGLFYFGFPLAMILNGPVSGYLVSHGAVGAIKGWQIMLLVEGLFAVLVGVVTWFCLPEAPARVAWLSNDERAALAPEGAAAGAPAHNNIRAALLDASLLLLIAVYFLIQAGVYGVVFYMPARIAAALGHDIDATTGLLSSLPWVCALIFSWWLPRFADRRRAHALFGGALLLAAAGGSAITAFFASLPVVLAGYSLALAGLIAAQPMFWVLSTRRFDGLIAASLIALINSLGNLGGFVAPNLRALLDRGFGSPNAGAVGLALCPLLGALLLFALPARAAPQGIRLPTRRSGRHGEFRDDHH